MEPVDRFTTRAEIEAVQVERLPSVARRVLLHLRPKQALSDATMQDALELSAADVVESGREFIELSDAERQEILVRNYGHCLQRNLGYLRSIETEN